MTDTGPRFPLCELPILEEIALELERVFRASELESARISPRPHLRRWRGARLAVALAIALLLAAAVALAAGGLLAGSPVEPPFELTPTAGDGVPIGASMVPLSVPDPAGGPPWAVRIVHTSRGLGCIQVGRLVGGTLAVLGQDGAFGDDGRFHPLPTQVFDDIGCAALDAHGQLFLAAARTGVPASGDQQACLPPVRGLIAVHGEPVCPRADERTIYFGALGPLARSITIRAGSRQITMPTAGQAGVYLIVRRAPSGADPNVFGARSPNRSSLLPSGEGQPITRVSYGNGITCRIRSGDAIDGTGRPCRAPGYVPFRSSLTAAAVRAPLHIGSKEETFPANPPFRLPVATVSFLARVALTRAGDYYEAHISFPCGGSATTIVNHGDVAAGQRLTASLQMTAGGPGSELCLGTYRISVRLVSGHDYSGESYGMPGEGASNIETVGTGALHVPRRGTVRPVR